MLALLLVLYVAVALLNYSLVQSLVASAASSYFSSQFGGKVRIASIGCNPFNHLSLRQVELISPSNDTICTSGRIDMSFDRFPLDKYGLSFSHVRLKDTYYHLAIDTNGLNLKYIIDHYKKPKDPADTMPVEFKVVVDDFVMENVNYRQDLKDLRDSTERANVNGVDVKHMEYRNINARFRNLRVDKDVVTCRIDHLTTTERSGLEVKRLNMNVYSTHSGISATNMHLETADSRLMGDVLIDFHSWKSMKHFLDSVVFTCHFVEGSYGNMRDAAYWAHTLWGMDERVDIEGWFYGPIADFHADDVRLAFGKESTIDLDASITGLPHIDSTVIRADIHRLHTSYADLAAVKHPSPVQLHAEHILKSMDVIDLEASFNGTIYNFFASVDATGKPGNVKSDVVLAMNPRLKEYRYVGQLSSDGFYLGHLAPNEWVSRTGFDISFEGTGFNPKTMNAAADGRLYHTVLKGQRILGETTIDVEAADGKIAADLSLDDPLAEFVAHAESQFRPDGQTYRASVNFGHLDLHRLDLWSDTNDSEAVVAAALDAVYVLRDESTYGRLRVDNLTLNTTTRHARLSNATLTAREQHYWKNVTLRSDVVNAQLRGYFDYDGFSQIAAKFCDDYLPSTFVAGSKPMEYDRIADARFEFDAEFVDTAALLNLFVPSLSVAPGTTLQANYSFVDGLRPILRSDSISIGSLRLTNVGLNGESLGDYYRLRLTGDQLNIGDMRFAENPDINLQGSQSSLFAHLYWENEQGALGGGDINLRLLADSNVLRLLVDDSRLSLGDAMWTLSDMGNFNAIVMPRATVGKQASAIVINGLSLRAADTEGTSRSPQSLMVRALLEGRNSDSIVVNLSHINLNIADAFLSGSGVNIDGAADGDILIGFVDKPLLADKSGSDMHGTETVPYLNADLLVDSLGFNGENLGNARIRSTWNADLDQLNLYVSTSRSVGGVTDVPLQLTGYLSLANADPELDFQLLASDVNLEAINPFVSSFSSSVSGSLTADLNLLGTLSHPLPSGMLILNDAAVKVDLLNVTYALSDTIMVDTSSIRLDNVAIVDQTGGIALANGSIAHSGFKDFAFNLRLASDRLLCMNTTSSQSDLYYGTIYAAVDGSVDGPVNNIAVLLDATTLDGSSLHVPVNDNRQVAQADFIHFLSPSDDFPSSFHIVGETSKSAVMESERRRQSQYALSNVVPSNKFMLTINVSATPDMVMHLPIDLSSVTLDVTAQGDGDLQLSLGTGSPFSLVGDYELNDGTLLLDLLGVLSKEFSIDQGSSITFPGVVTDALFDIRAVYSQHVNLSTLTGSLSSTESQKAVVVENVISLQGTLKSPDIDFDIRLPNADQTVQEEVFSYIDRTNERDMLNQTVSLLLQKRFYNASAGNAVDAAPVSASEEAYSLVANAVGSVLSDMVEFVDVNFAYQAGSALTTDQYAVDISKQWNKFYFESTFGIGGESREMYDAGQGNNLTGDMLVGYKINPRLHLFVFNRSNTNDYTRSDLPYKQGAGLKYTRDFDSFRELFSRKR